MIEHANSFATIVGLLSAFIGGRESQKTAELNDFVAWLTEHNHNELVSAINQNQATAVSIKALLNQNLQAVQGKLNELSMITAKIASRIDGLSELAAILAPGTELSEQSISLLSKMCSDNVEFVLLSETMAGVRLIASNPTEITISEPIFIKDDLSSLVSLGLLRLDFNNSGGKMFCITRLAYKYIASAKKSL